MTDDPDISDGPKIRSQSNTPPATPESYCPTMYKVQLGKCASHLLTCSQYLSDVTVAMVNYDSKVEQVMKDSLSKPSSVKSMSQGNLYHRDTLSPPISYEVK